MKTTTILEEARALQSEIVQLRRQLHMKPELSFKEFETSKLMAKKLEELGYLVKTGIGGTGVTGDLGTGKTVAIRADMDGLPVKESNTHGFQSQNDGVMHACGHDTHMSCAVAVAKILSSQKLPGRVRMIMQPAEEDVDAERKSGARRMIEAGVMDGVSAVIGLHVDASLPAGKVVVQPGPVMAAADGFRVTITGKGGHGGYPEATIDSVVIAAQVIQAIQQIVSRRIAATEPAVVTVGAVHSSSARGNVISNSVELLGSIRSFNETTRQKLMQELDRACSITTALGGSYHIEYEMGYPATVNDPDVAAVMREAAIACAGEENVLTLPPKTWAEDFSMLAQAAPGAFMFLGGEIAGDRRAHHSPNFDVDESGLYLGTAILAETARRLLER